VTTFELVMDDPWFPQNKYTNEDDFCSVLVHGWELEWYWDSWSAEAANMVDIWFSRETGAADFCLSNSAAVCRGPTDGAEDFCITYWVKCDPKPYSSPSTVEQDLISDAWSSWFGW
jgi:hypothetical protein